MVFIYPNEIYKDGDTCWNGAKVPSFLSSIKTKNTAFYCC